MYRSIVKPLLDIIAALIAIIIFSPIILLVFFLLLLNNNGSVFFFQKRPGKNGRIFKIIKFKTMNDRKDSLGNLLPDSKRLTKLGNTIRKLSLDELPQLFNVIKGDMSLVGPRPLLPEYLSLYNLEQARRHEVKPGITGWAQVNGRNAITWEDKFIKDVWYVKKQSFFLDLKIVFKTIKKVLVREDINTIGEATTKRFTGSL